MNVNGKTAKGFFVFGALYPKVTGGMEIFNYYFLRHFLRQGSDLLYWTENAVSGYESRQVQNRSLWPVSLFYPVELFFAILRNRRKISFVYTGYARTSWIIPFTSSLIFRLFRLPYIVTIHSGGSPGWKFAYPFRTYFRHAYAVIGVSESICHDYGREVPGKEIRFIPPLIPLEKSAIAASDVKSEFSIPSDHRVLLYAGSLKGMKNPDKVLEGFREFVQRNPEAKLSLFFAGSGEMEQRLRDYVKQHDLSGRVILAGGLPREKMPELYTMASYYCISSDWEGTSLSLLEAMFNRLAIVGADSPGINKMLVHGRTALLYPVKDTGAFCRQLEILYNDDELAGSLASAAEREYHARYSYDKMINEYENLFRAIA